MDSKEELGERERSDLQDAHGYERWNRIYLAVIIFTILVIISLWVFSRVFS